MITWFRSWRDAFDAALFWADLTNRRYRVRYDRANRWWDVTETTVRFR